VQYFVVTEALRNKIISTFSKFCFSELKYCFLLSNLLYY